MPSMAASMVDSSAVQDVYLCCFRLPLERLPDGAAPRGVRRVLVRAPLRAGVAGLSDIKVAEPSPPPQQQQQSCQQQQQRPSMQPVRPPVRRSTIEPHMPKSMNKLNVVKKSMIDGFTSSR